MFLVNINRSSTIDIAKLLQTQSQTEMKNAFFIVLIYTVQGRGVLLSDVERRINTISQTCMYRLGQIGTEGINKLGRKETQVEEQTNECEKNMNVSKRKR